MGLRLHRCSGVVLLVHIDRLRQRGFSDVYKDVLASGYACAELELMRRTIKPCLPLFIRGLIQGAGASSVLGSDVNIVVSSEMLLEGTSCRDLVGTGRERTNEQVVILANDGHSLAHDRNGIRARMIFVFVMAKVALRVEGLIAVVAGCRHFFVELRIEMQLECEMKQDRTMGSRANRIP